MKEVITIATVGTITRFNQENNNNDFDKSIYFMASFLKPLVSLSELIQEKVQGLQGFAFCAVTVFDEHRKPRFKRKPRVSIEI